MCSETIKVSKKNMDQYESLLSDFGRLDPIPRYTPTIFEISKFPHYEDVMSNVLEFFFDSDYDHGFSSIFVRALLEAAGRDTKDLEYSELLVQEVEREYSTNEGNRIDLVIETETYCIAVEHKIYAGLYNDLEEYQNSIEFKSDKENVFIVLVKGEKLKPDTWGNHDFKLVTYNRFLDKVERHLGSQISSADSRILMYIGDYIKTIRNLNRRTNMSEEFLRFLTENKEEVESLYQHAFKDFKNEIEAKAKEIDGEIELENTHFKRFHYNPQDKLKYVQGYKRKISSDGSEFELRVKLRLKPDKYELEIWCPNSAEHQLFKSFIENHLFANQPPKWDLHDNNTRISVTKNGSIGYGSAPKDVALEIQELLNEIEEYANFQK